MQGKFAQRDGLSKHEYLKDVKRYLALMSSSAVVVQNLKVVNEVKPMLMIQYKPAEGHEKASPHTNVVLAAFVTAQARLKLYGYMDKVKDRLMYSDTDCCFYSHRPGQDALPLGDHLGDMTNEVPGDTIRSACFAGVKNYAYSLASGKTVCKIRGFSLNYRTSQKINYESMKEIMMSDDRFERRIDTVEPNALIKKGTAGTIYTKPRPKQYKFVFDKRRIVDKVDTRPFGYVD